MVASFILNLSSEIDIGYYELLITVNCNNSSQVYEKIFSINFNSTFKNNICPNSKKSPRKNQKYFSNF